MTTFGHWHYPIITIVGKYTTYNYHQTSYKINTLTGEVISLDNMKEVEFDYMMEELVKWANKVFKKDEQEELKFKESRKKALAYLKENKVT